MPGFLVFILVMVYIASLCGLGFVYGQKGMGVTFWAFLILLLPGVNTFFAIRENIKYNSNAFKEFFSFKSFVDDFNRK